MKKLVGFATITTIFGSAFAATALQFNLAIALSVWLGAFCVTALIAIAVKFIVD